MKQNRKTRGIQDAVSRIYARYLYLLGFRTSVVTDATGLSESQARNLKKELKEEGIVVKDQPGPGSMADGLVNSRSGYLQASILMNIYRSLNPNAERNLDLESVIEAYSIYLKEIGAIFRNSIDYDLSAEGFERFTIQQAYSLAAALRSNDIDYSASMRECPDCKTYFYFTTRQTVVDDCPFCNWRVRSISSGTANQNAALP
ncbi:FlhC family transcriptional regulator [Hydrocarboniclastica marina]|nr:FlhC family transcriptional regulator [Hydrocarboniclastica marina]